MASATLTIEPAASLASHAIMQVDTTPDASSQTAITSIARATNDDVAPAASTHSLRPSLSWQSFRSKMSISEKTSAHLGWIVAFLSVLFTVVALSPAFKSQSMTERALQLAEWTALKDFIEECREELAAGVESQACLKAMKAQIPPPPYVKSGMLDKMRRNSRLEERHKPNGTMWVMQAKEQSWKSASLIRGFIGLAVVLTVCISLSLSYGHGRVSLRHRSTVNGAQEDEKRQPYEPPSVLDPDPVESKTTVRDSPRMSDSTLRHRSVRTHPIYRHASLDDAIHAADLPEIRTRLRNGEDVNQHWPYLIYRLAITPKAPNMAERIEVARLCLDYGADVNALKGWNGQSALLIAIHFGNIDVAKLLIASGAAVDYSPPDSHLTALQRCVRLASTGSPTDALEIMELLFKHGAKANQMDRLNETPLHKLLIDAWYAREKDATFDKLFPIALCLVEHGARLSPGSIKHKFTDGNPLYELVQASIWERTRRSVR